MPKPQQRAPRRLAQVLGKRRQDRRARFDQDDAGDRGIDGVEFRRAAPAARSRRARRPARRRSGRRRSARTSEAAADTPGSARARPLRTPAATAAESPAHRRASSVPARPRPTRRGRSTNASRRRRQSGSRTPASVACPSEVEASSRCFAVESMRSTFASSTRSRCCLRRIQRIGDAMSPGDSPAVAT